MSDIDSRTHITAEASALDRSALPAHDKYLIRSVVERRLKYGAQQAREQGLDPATITLEDSAISELKRIAGGDLTRVLTTVSNSITYAVEVLGATNQIEITADLIRATQDDVLRTIRATDGQPAGMLPNYRRSV